VQFTNILLLYSLLSEEMGNAVQREEQSPSIMDETIALDIKNASWSPTQRATTLSRLMLKREINFNCPLNTRDKVRISQKLIPSNGYMRFQYDHQVFCGQFSRDGTVFMSACQDRHIRLYDTESWKQTKDILAKDIGWSIIDTDYSPDQRWLIYSSWSDYVHICNIGGYEMHEGLDFVPGYERFCLFSIKFAPDSNEILGGSSDRHLYIYDLNRKERTVRVEAHEDDINSVCYLDGTGNIIVSGSDDQMVKIWDRRLFGSPEAAVGLLPGHVQGITHVSPKGDGRYVISNGKDQCTKLWDIRACLSPTQKVDRKRGLRWDYRSGPLGFGLNLAGREAYNSAHNPEDRSLMTYRGHRVLQTLIRAYFSPAYSTGQKYIYTGSYDGSVYVYDVLTGAQVARLRGHRAIIRDLSWHPFDTTMATTSWDGSVWEWSVEDVRDRPACERPAMRSRTYAFE